MTSADPGRMPRISEMTPSYQFPRTIGQLVAAREAQLKTLPPAVPDCPNGHGPMQARPLDRQTYEQLFCGVWWDCRSGCASSSCATSRDLAYQNGEPYRNGATWEKFDGAGWVPIPDAEAERFWAARGEWHEASKRGGRLAQRRKRLPPAAAANQSACNGE